MSRIRKSIGFVVYPSTFARKNYLPHSVGCGPGAPASMCRSMRASHSAASSGMAAHLSCAHWSQLAAVAAAFLHSAWSRSPVMSGMCAFSPLYK